jgi:hypothetical protein
VPRNLRCWLLCEDLAQEHLFRPILESQFRRIRVEPRKPHGGASFVLQQVKRLAAYIRQRPQEAVALLVVIDGDEAGHRNRLDEIRAAGGLGRAAWTRRIAVCVPCRNVETWALWLCGAEDLDEVSDYKAVFRREVERGTMSIRQAVEAWSAPLAEARRRAEERRLPSLTHGRREVARLDQLAARAR